MSEPDLDYYEARRQARSILGQNADVSKDKTLVWPARVGVWVQNLFVLVGAGKTYREALDDARSRQEWLKVKQAPDAEHGPYCTAESPEEPRVFCAEPKGHTGAHAYLRALSVTSPVTSGPKSGK